MSDLARGHRFALPSELTPSKDLSVAEGLVSSVSDPGCADDRRRILQHLASYDDALVRTCRPGHLTGSAFVVDPLATRTVVLFHTKLRRWLQPGGHADGDANLAAVALREAREETGLQELRVVLPAVDLDIHHVEPPSEDAHVHFDVRFAVVAGSDGSLRANQESEQLRWVTRRELADLDLDPGLRRLAARAFEVARGLRDPAG